jgi:uncharacterized protein (TIGR00251 family)
LASGRLRVRVRLTPRGGRDRIDGFAADAKGGRVLKVRVAAPPVDGAANAALVRLMAKALGVPRSAVRIASGEASRTKTLEIAGDAAVLAARLDTLGRDGASA